MTEHLKSPEHSSNQPFHDLLMAFGARTRMFHKLTDDQQEILDSLKRKAYEIMKPSADYASTYMTNSGITFTWLHGLGNGREVKIEGIKQPEWFARRVRKLINGNESYKSVNKEKP